MWDLTTALEQAGTLPGKRQSRVCDGYIVMFLCIRCDNILY